MSALLENSLKMNRAITLLFFTIVLLAHVESKGCQGDKDGTNNCWPTQNKRNDNCGAKPEWRDKNYCGRRNGDYNDRCHCCGTTMNSGCRVKRGDQGSTTINQRDYKCLPTIAERDKQCVGFPKHCQMRGSFNVSYCCGKNAYPAVC